MHTTEPAPALFLKLSAELNTAWVHDGRTSGVISRKISMLTEAQSYGMNAVPWGFHCPDKTARQIRDTLASPGGLEMLMIYRHRELPVTTDTVPDSTVRGPNALDFLAPSPTVTTWIRAGFHTDLGTGPGHRVLALTDITEYADPYPVDLGQYTHASTGRALSTSMRGSLSHAIGVPARRGAGAMPKICWVQGRARILALFDPLSRDD